MDAYIKKHLAKRLYKRDVSDDEIIMLKNKFGSALILEEEENVKSERPVTTTGLYRRFGNFGQVFKDTNPELPEVTEYNTK